MATSQPDTEEILAQFQSITGADAERSRFYLESANGELQLALTAFFDRKDEDESDESRQPEAPKPKPAPPPKVKSTSNIHHFGSLNNDDDDDDDDEGQAFYAGGSRASGQQILGPPKKKGRDVVAELFKKAREHGAETSEPGPSSSDGRKTFAGKAFRLGSTENDTMTVEDDDDEEDESMPEPREFVLKMWQNGFSVDDGELRDFNNERDWAFLNSIMRGKIPPELIKEARGGEVYIKIEDHKTEEYVKPKASVKPFQGEGRALGSVLPSSEEPAAKAPPPPAPANPAEEVKVDDSKPVVNMQVRLNDGGKLIVKLNAAHTVGDLRRFIVLSRPQYAASEFFLLTTFPSKELNDDAVTLEDAGLQGAAVLLRLK